MQNGIVFEKVSDFGSRCDEKEPFPALVTYSDDWADTLFSWADNFSRLTISNVRRTLIGNKIVDHSDVVGASPVGAAPTTSSFST